MSWRDPKWVYQPAATHGDSQAFAQRQRERAESVKRALSNVFAVYGDSTYRSTSSGLELRCTRGKQ